MNVSPPVHQQRDWRHLQRAVVNEHRALGAMVQKNFRAQFTCAASIAVWLLQHRPDLLARPTLTVLIAQATEFEALDSGRWLQFIPWLLGRPGLVLHAAIVGDFEGAGAADGDLEHRLRTHSWPLVRDRAPAELVQGRVGDWLRDRPDRFPDLCAVFSPEFARRHALLLGPDGLQPLLRRGVPLALFSSSEAEQLVDLYTLRASRLLPREPDAWPNPWAIEPAGLAEGSGYARMGWAAEFDVVPTAAEPELMQLVALDESLTYVRDLLEAAGDDAFLTLGEAIRAAAETGEADQGSVLLRLPRDVAVDTANGHFYQIGESSAWLLGSVPRVDPALFQTFPGHDDLVARAMWAIGLHRDHVLPHTRSLDEELRAELVNRPEFAATLSG